jgi:teichuronic acid biosynthesis glycosyltransferase TuaC
MTNKIKLLVITHSFPTKYNPIATIFILNQLEALKKECDIKVIYPHAYVPKFKFLNQYHRFSKIPNKELIKGIEVLHSKYFMFPRILFVPKLLNFFLFIEAFLSNLASKKLAERTVEKWNPDIIHIHGLLADGLIGLNLKKKYHKPVVVNVWGEDVTKFSKEMFSKNLAHRTLRNSDAIICQSNFLKNEIKKLRIKNRFFTITVGPLLSRFKPKEMNRSRKDLKLPENKRIILFVGGLIPRKGVEFLIKATRLIARKDKDILVLLIGRGFLKAKLKKLASELKLDNNVKFLGIKNNEDIVKYMNASEVFVLPSLNEGLPVVLCEALACGKPVVATSVAGTPELVTKDVGYLVKTEDEDDLAQKIMLALNNKWDKSKILKRGREFSVDNAATKLLKVYKYFISK